MTKLTKDLARQRLIATVLARVAEEYNGPAVWPDHSSVFPAQWAGKLEYLDCEIDVAAKRLAAS